MSPLPSVSISVQPTGATPLMPGEIVAKTYPPTWTSFIISIPPPKDCGAPADRFNYTFERWECSRCGKLWPL